MKPARPPLPYGAALIGETERAAVDAVLSSGPLYRYHGSAVSALEQRFAAWIGHDARALAVNSGTSALQLALAACELEDRAEVLVPTFGFVSAATAVHAVGGVPRFVGVDRSTAMDVAAAEDAVGDRTGAILAVHPHGTPCDLDGVMALAHRHGLLVVEDVAQACGGSFRGRRLGTFGHAAAFSFQHFKLIATGEGGMVATADRGVHDRASFLHDSAAVWTMPNRVERIASVRGAPGNLRMSELEGALGLVQLERCDRVVADLRAVKARALEMLSDSERCAPATSADAAGDVGTHLIVYMEEKEEAVEAVAALAERGFAASPLLGERGTTRHWAGDWGAVLERCGIALPEPEVIERDRQLLETGVVVQLDVTLDEDDVQGWLDSLATALG